VGLAPIQRDGMEYEFTTVFDVAMDHNTAISKDRTGLFDGKIFKISTKTGKALLKWLNGAAPEEVKTEQTTTPVTPPKTSADQSGSKTAHMKVVGSVTTPPVQPPVADPGDFVLNFTKGYNGKKIREIPVSELLGPKGLIVWCINKQTHLDFVQAAEAYLRSLDSEGADENAAAPVDELDAHLAEEMPSFDKFK
jgi:hypothetical protein